MDRFEVTLTEDAQADLDNIKDNRTYAAIERKLDELETEPDKRGKPLSGDLQRLYSVRAAGQRYRILYRIDELDGLVVVVVIGIRMEGDKRDVYQVARKRLRRK